MLLIPKAAYACYLGYLKKCSIDEALFPEYVKWLRYYLDFCGKYLITDDTSQRLQQFMKKLICLPVVKKKQLSLGTVLRELAAALCFQSINRDAT